MESRATPRVREIGMGVAAGFAAAVVTSLDAEHYTGEVGSSCAAYMTPSIQSRSFACGTHIPNQHKHLSHHSQVQARTQRSQAE